MTARRVIVVSPYSGKTGPGDVGNAADRKCRNTAYARLAVRDCLDRGEAPVAFHILYTQPSVIADGDPDERAMGMARARDWYTAADAVVVYDDFGVSDGMQEDIEHAQGLGIPVEWRKLHRLTREVGESATTAPTIDG